MPPLHQCGSQHPPLFGCEAARSNPTSQVTCPSGFAKAHFERRARCSGHQFWSEGNRGKILLPECESGPSSRALVRQSIARDQASRAPEPWLCLHAEQGAGRIASLDLKWTGHLPSTGFRLLPWHRPLRTLASRLATQLLLRSNRRFTCR